MIITQSVCDKARLLNKGEIILGEGTHYLTSKVDLTNIHLIGSSKSRIVSFIDNPRRLQAALDASPDGGTLRQVSPLEISLLELSL